MDTKQQRQVLWLGKFTFPKIDTKRTKIQIIPPHFHEYCFAHTDPLDVSAWENPSEYIESNRELVQLQKWRYNGKRRNATIRFGYYERLDILVVAADSQLRDFWFDGNIPTGTEARGISSTPAQR